jgi:hypothetical protein
MTKISASPDRHFFQKEGYIKRMEEKDESPNEDYLDWFQTVLEEHRNKFDDPASQENNLEYDLLTTEWILNKVRASDAYAQNLYAATCSGKNAKSCPYSKISTGVVAGDMLEVSLPTCNKKVTTSIGTVQVWATVWATEM